MIILAVVAACMGAVLVILALLPAWTPVDLSGPVAAITGTALFDGLGWLNHYLPVDTMLTLLSLQLTIWAAVYVVRFVIWLLQLFHVAGGADSGG
jgi:hypothetical protein